MPKEYSPTSSARAISSSRCAIRSSGPIRRSVQGSVTAATKLSTPTCTAVLLGSGSPPATVQCSTSQAGPADRKSTTSELQSRQYLVCRLLLEKKKKTSTAHNYIT